MYPASNEFHAAVRNGNEQKALLIFPDCVFTDDDISVENGIEFHEYFNAEEDLSIGQTLSNEISFSLFNDSRKLNDYSFGDFQATLGVYIGEDTYQQRGDAMVTTLYATYTGYGSYPYIFRNNATLPTQPNFAVASILAYDGNVFCFGKSGQFAVYDDRTGINITYRFTLNAFMKEKVKTWVGKGVFLNKDSRILFIYENGKRKRYEFVPLGSFTAERPNAPDVIQIDMTCYDYMQKFEKDMPSNAELNITFPITIGNLFVAMCNYVGVPYETSTFINSTATISKRPDDFDNATMRDVLKWIAEAAGSNARFNRDGILVMDWLRETDQHYAATGYSEFNPYWYETKKVTRLYNRDTQGGGEHTYGNGDEGYLIQDNPLLKGVT